MCLKYWENVSFIVEMVWSISLVCPLSGGSSAYTVASTSRVRNVRNCRVNYTHAWLNYQQCFLFNVYKRFFIFVTFLTFLTFFILILTCLYLCFALNFVALRCPLLHCDCSAFLAILSSFLRGVTCPSQFQFLLLSCVIVRAPDQFVSNALC